MNFESRRGQDDGGTDDEQNKYAVSLFSGGGVDVCKNALNNVLKAFKKSTVEL